MREGSQKQWNNDDVGHYLLSLLLNYEYRAFPIASGNSIINDGFKIANKNL